MATLALTSVKKDSAGGGILRVRYEFAYAANGTNDDAVSLADVANEGVWTDKYPDAVSYAVVADQADTEIDVADGPDVVQSFDFANDNFDLLVHFAAAPSNGDECDIIVIHEFWDAADQDGSSITATV